MLNKEKYHDEIFGIACNGESVAVVNGKPCACIDVDCCDCIFCHNTETKCMESLKKWCDEEYKEPLKPCPFCGSENVVISGCENLIYVKCDKCLTRTAECATEERATELWNRRASDED